MNPQIVFLLNKALESLSNSNLDLAELYLKQAQRLQARNPDVLRFLGVISAQRREYRDAIKYFNDSIKAFPKNSAALSNLGNVFLELKEYGKALEAYDKSLNIDQKSGEVWSNKGNALQQLKRYEEAIVHYDRAINLKPDYAEAWSNKGNALQQLKLYEEAITHYDQALSIRPDYAEAWANKGWALHSLKRISIAIAHYDKALSLKSDYATGWCNKGWALHELQRYEEAITHYDQALSIRPDYAQAWASKGHTLTRLGRLDDAITSYDKALCIKEDLNWATGDLLLAKMKICNWLYLPDMLEKLFDGVRLNEKFSNPFPLLAMSDDALLIKKCSEIYTQNEYPKILTLGKFLNKYKHKKTKIGYFSADFGNHPVSILTAELFELHDKNQFETFAFSYGADDRSEMRTRLTKSFTEFIDVQSISDQEIAQLARNLEIDIAIDLGGHTESGRMGIFAYRAAPIQLSYIGFLGTMGADYYDYLLADKTIIPNGSEHFYSEKIAYLPTYQVNDRKRIISDRQFTRQELGLPENGFVFCCFNNNYKILPSVFDSWMRILKTIDDSVLFLYTDNQWSKANLINEARVRGIDSTRLVFGERISSEEYLARYRVCDLFLDTFPYNAGTTASDALWTGLPVLTMMGSSFASRVAASLLNAIGLPELITSSQEEYEALAIELASNPHKLIEIKLKLECNRLTAPLFNTPLFAKNIELAYIKMYERYQADLEPEHIYIN